MKEIEGRAAELRRLNDALNEKEQRIGIPSLSLPPAHNITAESGSQLEGRQRELASRASLLSDLVRPLSPSLLQLLSLAGGERGSAGAERSRATGYSLSLLRCPSTLSV